jgi:hypothetical protein
MKTKLLCHLKGDDDLLDAWFEYYSRLGVSSFHLIVHGPEQENCRLRVLKHFYPVVIEDSYEGPFDSEEKKRRLNLVLERMRGEWILLVDSDEFVEFPYKKLSTTIRVLQLTGRTALSAPMVQHLTPDGSLNSPPIVEDPFHTFPLCSVDLYRRMGTDAAIDKYPLFLCGPGAMLLEGGNHFCPQGTSASSLRGVTHHFKFRASVIRRINSRIESLHPWRHESVQQKEYLALHQNRLPLDGAFRCSRRELFRRGLLRKLGLINGLRFLRRAARRVFSKPHSGGPRAVADRYGA